MTTEFTALRRQGIYASSQTLPSGFRVDLRKDMRHSWGVGDTLENALQAALREWSHRYGNV